MRIPCFSHCYTATITYFIVISIITKNYVGLLPYLIFSRPYKWICTWMHIIKYNYTIHKYVVCILKWVRSWQARWAIRLLKIVKNMHFVHIMATQGAKPQFFGKPDMACCKRLCNKNIIHGPSGVNWSCTTLKICYWIGVVALITVPPSMTKRCCIKSPHNGQVYVIYLFPINLVHFIGTNIMKIVQ